jgi:hypothetical protein
VDGKAAAELDLQFEGLGIDRDIFDEAAAENVGRFETTRCRASASGSNSIVPDPAITTTWPTSRLQAIRDACKTTRADDIGHARKGTIYEVFENHDMKVRLHGDAALITGRTTVKGTAGETPFATEFQFTDTLVRQDGRWRVAASHVSRISA